MDFLLFNNYKIFITNFLLRPFPLKSKVVKKKKNYYFFFNINTHQIILGKPYFIIIIYQKKGKEYNKLDLPFYKNSAT